MWIEPAQLIQKLKQDRHCDARALQIRHKSGEVRDVLASVQMIQFDGSAHLLITAADLTERNRARQMEHIAHHDMLTDLPKLLRMAAARLQGRIRATDILARVGGDEFIALLEGLADTREAETIAAGLVQQMSAPFMLSRGREVRISASVGISYLTAQVNDVELFVRQADAALYTAKSAGRNTVRIFQNAAGRMN